MKENYDLESLLKQIIKEIIVNSNLILNTSFDNSRANYQNLLFKINVPMAFERASNLKFMGIIKSVSENGLLEILLEDDTIKQFSIKEILMLY